MTLHLVRHGEPLALTEHDWVVYLDRLELADRGTPPLPPGSISHDQLVTLIVAATRVITW
jgi:hypothetical protein